MLNTIVLVFTLIAGLIMFLRLCFRGLLLHKAGAEDAWISLAMVSVSVHLNKQIANAIQILSIGLTITIALQVQNGLGKHIQELTPLMKTNSLKVKRTLLYMCNID